MEEMEKVEEMEEVLISKQVLLGGAGRGGAIGKAMTAFSAHFGKPSTTLFLFYIFLSTIQHLFFSTYFFLL